MSKVQCLMFVFLQKLKNTCVYYADVLNENDFFLRRDDDLL